MKNYSYKIYDWAGNLMVWSDTYDTFEAAWDAIYDRFHDLNDDQFDLECGEYFVLPEQERSAA
jgi:hypothetical protein